MKLTFYGGARQVTGSRHLLEVNGNKLLLDCGMFQGRRKDAEENNRNLPFDPKEILAVVLSHAHIDHSGAIPTLVNQGFEGWIYSTRATADICSYMLADSAHIQEKDVEYMNRKLTKRGEPLLEPIYTTADAIKSLKQFVGIGYDKDYPNIIPGVTLRFLNAGHILGSAIIQLYIDDQETGKKHTLTFTGDLGRDSLPLLPDPSMVVKSDIVLMESTYGNRFHDDLEFAENELAETINKTFSRGGKVIIPAFSLGRTQEIVYSIHKLIQAGKLKDSFPIFVDSPLSANLTEVFRSHPEMFDEETRKIFLDNNVDPFGFDRLTYTKKVEDSKAINDINGPCIIISSSGMCEFGRILHHLKNNIEDHRNTLIAVGFMAQHTLGRKLIEGEKKVKIFGDMYDVQMEVKTMNAYSAHADKNDLMEFATRIKDAKDIFLVHGEESQMEHFKGELGAKHTANIHMPEFGQTFEL